jgi:NitT/TauT family transport system substrate-binding protein
VVFGGPEIAAEFSSGRLKIGELGTPPGLTAIAQGAKFKIIGSGVRRGAVQFFVVIPRITNWQDLVGKRLGALSRGSCSYWFMRRILRQNGLDPDCDVEIVGLGGRYPEVVEMLGSGELDGAIIAEPNVTVGERNGAFSVWFGLNGVDYVPRMQWTIAVCNNDILAAEPEMVAAVLRACRRSYHYAAANPDEWADFGARQFGLSRDIMTAAIAREMDALHFDCQIDIPGLQAAIELQRSLGAVTDALELDQIIDSRFQDATT